MDVWGIAGMVLIPAHHVLHRWAMMGAAGIMGVELLGFGNWYDAPVEALNGGHSTYLGAPVPFDLATLTAIVS